MSETNNLPAVKFELPELTSKLTNVQLGWLKMSDMKTKTFEQLQAGELKVQEFLNKIRDEKDLPKIQERIKNAKNEAAEKKEIRLHLTTTIQEKLIKPSMEFEKRNEELIAKASEWELERRQEVVKSQEAANNLLKEKQSYGAHIKNEYLRIQGEYKLTLTKRIAWHYQQCLEKKKKMTKAELEQYQKDMIVELGNIELAKPVKFNRVLVSKEDAKAIVDSILPPVWKNDLDEAIETISTVFAMYSEDFKNKEKAIESINEGLATAQQEIQSSLTQESAINDLVANVDSISYSGGAVLKKQFVIEEENTQEYALAVIASFITYFQMARKHLRVQTWNKLSIGQMATALSKYANEYTPVKKYPNLKMKEEVK